MFVIKDIEENSQQEKPGRAKRLLKDSKAFRRGWGGVKPVERIDKSLRSYNRQRFNDFDIDAED